MISFRRVRGRIQELGNGEPSELSCRLLDPRFGRGRSVFICVVPAIRVHVAPGEERAEVDSSRWPYKYFTNCQARPRQRLAFSPNWKLCYPHVRTLAILWSPTHRSSSMDRRTGDAETRGGRKGTWRRGRKFTAFLRRRLRTALLVRRR